MKYFLVVDPALRDQIRHYPPELKHKVRQSLERIVKTPFSGKALVAELRGYHSYRVGRFRIIYQVLSRDIFLVAIGPRKTIYQKIMSETKRSN